MGCDRDTDEQVVSAGPSAGPVRVDIKGASNHDVRRFPDRSETRKGSERAMNGKITARRPAVVVGCALLLVAGAQAVEHSTGADAEVAFTFGIRAFNHGEYRFEDTQPCRNRL